MDSQRCDCGIVIVNNGPFSWNGACQRVSGEPCLPCQQLEALEKRINDMQRSLRGLTEEYFALKTRRNEQHDMMTTLLPVELLSKIFVEGLPAEGVLSHYRPPEKENTSNSSFIPEAPIVYGMVCRLWRKVALNTPLLWSSVPIRLDCGHQETQMSIAIDWINRTRQLPLSIGVYARSYPEDWEPTRKTWTPLFDVVNLQYKRWSALDIFNVPTKAFKLLHGVDTSVRPHLDRLDIYLQESSTELLFRTGGILLSPRELSIRNVMFKTLNIGWLKLTTVSITHAFPNHIKAVVHRAPNLQKMTLRNPKFSGGFDFHMVDLPPIVKHPRLKDLSLAYTVDQYFSPVVISPLELPNLESIYLRLENLGSYTDELVLPFISLSPQIARFVLHTNLLSRSSVFNGMVRVLQSLPNVEQFEVKAPDPTELLEHLCPFESPFEDEDEDDVDENERNEYNLLPKLSSLIVESAIPLNWSWIILTLLKRRCDVGGSVVHIESIKVILTDNNGGKGIDVEAAREIEEMRRGGRNVEIVDHLGKDLLRSSLGEGD